MMGLRRFQAVFYTSAFSKGDGMNTIEIVLTDGEEARFFANNKNEALHFLRLYRNRKSKGATVRVNPNGNMVEFFDTTRESAVKQAIAYVKDPEYLIW